MARAEMMRRPDAGHWVRVSRRTHGFEDTIRPAVWVMVQSTYAKIGLILNHPGELDEYDVWDLFEDADGNLSAFRLGKTTSFGIKGGLAGSDGSRAGRTALKQYLGEWYLEDGHYAEVSHRMQELAFEAGAFVVCAEYVPEILGKPVIPEPDGVFYRRKIKNIGEVVKVLVGHPFGIPATPSSSPRCPLPPRTLSGRSAGARPDSSTEAIFSHAASLIDF